MACFISKCYVVFFQMIYTLSFKIIKVLFTYILLSYSMLVQELCTLTDNIYQNKLTDATCKCRPKFSKEARDLAYHVKSQSF